MTDSLPEAQSKSGLILKAAREEMSLSLEQVANELHLRPAVVKAIEEENYDEFSSDVFLKGYFRTYCRLVNLHEARMMDLLDKQLVSRHNKAEHIKQQAHKEVQLRKRKKLMISLAVFFISLLLVAFAYQLANQNNNNVIFESVEKAQNILTLANVEQTKTEQQSDSELVTSSSDDIANPQESSEVLNNTPQALNEQLELIEAEQLEAINEEQLEVIEEKYIEPNELEETNKSFVNTESPVILSSLKASFTGDCWFKVTDSSGKVVIAELKKANDEVNYKGSAPFHVVIGDASKVSLFFQDKEVNLKPFTSRNGRAELTLRPSETDNEG